MKKLAAAVLLCIPLMAHSTFLTGAELFRYMTESNIVSKRSATTYIMGVADSMRARGCIPLGTASTQLFEITMIELASNQSKLYLPASDFVESAVNRTWRCK